MGIYKGVTVPDSLDGVIGYMRDVDACREELATLGQRWDLLSILGDMTGSAADMSAAREGFEQLTGELLAQLGTETLRKTVQQMTSKAQVAVDIVVRNLFERTADIGFLATDDDVRAFLRTREDRGALIARFREYVAKYSVYHDIVLMDTDGVVLARIDDSTPLQQSNDPLVREALTTRAPYVEVFRHSDLVPQERSALLYAYRVTESNDPQSAPLGVLCLCFRFENELEGVFRNLSEEGDWSTIVLLDTNGAVVASSDAQHIAIGATLEQAVHEPFRITRCAGRLYLAKTCETKGYQGYFGPGWRGHALVPLQHAFDGTAAHDSVHVESSVLDAVMHNTRLFTPALQRIPTDAQTVQRQLDRAVWNGNVRRDRNGERAEDGAAKVLLSEISKTGDRTRQVFERSISNLHETVVSSLLSDVEFLASLAIDIMDRNLYERANDCRWWALTTVFREYLAEPGQSRHDVNAVAKVLAYINGLYTVYDNLFVYDRERRIRAVSNPAHAALVGRTLREPWVAATLGLASSQHYTVSPFEPSDLYDGRATYVYGAAIASPGAGRHVVGGIGIVFDSQPQFATMLRDSLPRTAGGDVLDGAFGIFADASRHVIASTTGDIPVGSVLDLPGDLFALPAGQGTSQVIEWRGRYYAVGARSSSGYREYKSASDTYQNAVLSFVFVELGEAMRAAATQRHTRTLQVGSRSDRKAANALELATFYIGGRWMGVPVHMVLEAAGVGQVAKIPGAGPTVAGITTLHGQPIPVLKPGALFGTERSGETQMVVLQTLRGPMGVMVDELGEMPEVARERMEPLHAIVDGQSFVDGIVRPGEGERWPMLLLVVDPDRMCRSLLGREAADVVSTIERALSETSVAAPDERVA
jgi:chemotaxis signal transduction protein